MTFSNYRQESRPLFQSLTSEHIRVNFLPHRCLCISICMGIYSQPLKIIFQQMIQFACIIPDLQESYT